jgi:hypothetical protein
MFFLIVHGRELHCDSQQDVQRDRWRGGDVEAVGGEKRM